MLTTVQNVNMGDSEHPLLKFSDSAPQWQTGVVTTPDDTYCVADTPEVGLDTFMARPTLIYSTTWSVNSSLNATLRPWQLWFDNPRIANRISNFEMARGNLKIKVLINGNPFYYGRMLVAYGPHFGIGENGYGGVEKVDATRFSQLPHIFLDPTTSQGGEMTLPFYWYKNAMSLTSPANDYANMGFLILHTLNNLRHANAGIDPLSIKIFAWSDDMVLSVPTATNKLDLVEQMDEYSSEGLISRPAAALAAAAGKLTDVPSIAPYAKATQMASSAVAGVAKQFGYSKPVSAAPVAHYTPRFINNLASSVDIDTSTPLALDGKVELTVDPRTMGLDGTDEMSFDYIKKKESYIGTYTWNTANAPGVEIGSLAVTPTAHTYLASSEARGFSSLAFLAAPFNYWRGSIKYRFQIVASNFHRGRFMIQYDPNSDGVSPDVEGDENLKYSRIIDIATERDFTLEVGWGTTAPWLVVENMWENPPPFVNGPITIINNRSTTNGVLALSVLTSLSEPSAASDPISINVFVSGGDDLEFALPGDTENMYRMTPFPNVTPETLQEQMGEVDVEDDAANEPLKPEPQETILSSTQLGDSQDIFFGDPIVSLRSLMKRYVMVDTHFENTTGTSNLAIVRPARPLIPGYDPNGVHVGGISAYNYTNWSWFSYCSLAYQGYRGSHRWKTYFGSTNPSFPVGVTLAATTAATPKYTTASTPIGGSASSVAAATTFLPSGATGEVATVGQLNPVLEFTVPFYSNLRFHTTRTPSVLAGGGTNTSERTHIYKLMNDGVLYMTRYHAMGDDVVLSFYTGLPRMFDNKPSPVPG